MTDVPPREVHSCAFLIGFWQFIVEGRHYFGVLERSEDRTHSTLTIGRVVDGRSDVVRRVENEDVSVRGVDARTVASDLVLTIETNRGMPGQTVRTDLHALVDPAAGPAMFQSTGTIELTAQQVERVKLPPSRLWNAADALPPKQWVFSPRLVRGDGSAVTVIANAADGQAVTPGVDTPQGVAIPDAAEPQALLHGGHRVVAFRRPAASYVPYWMLPNYAGSEQAPPGDLMVVEDRLAAQNLSISLGLGPVGAFALAGGSDGAPWIFALQDDPSGVRVVVLARRADGWSVADRWTLGMRAERLSAENGAGGWHLLYAVRGGKGWSLQYESRLVLR